MHFPDILETLCAGEKLPREILSQIMDNIFTGGWDDAKIAAFLTAIKIKGIDADELATMVAALRRRRANPPRVDAGVTLLDTCGTGGDKMNTFNISTASAFVCAAGGVSVAKHGNRAVSSNCGSSDILTALGATLTEDSEQLTRLLTEVGFCFLFAPTHYAVMRHVAPVRQSLGVRTLFNLLGPLSNPAGAPVQMIGVFSLDIQSLYIDTLRLLDTERALVVHGSGLDEITLSGPSDIIELTAEREAARREIHPARFGMAPVPIEAIQPRDMAQSVEMFQAALQPAGSPQQDIVSLNAGAGLYVAGRADTLEDGVRLAQEIIASGAAAQKLQQFIDLSQRL